MDFTCNYRNILHFEQHMPEYLAPNLVGTVATMVIDGKIMTESIAMCEHIDAVHPGEKLVKDDPRERHRMCWWARPAGHTAATLSEPGWYNFLGADGSSETAGGTGTPY